MKLHYSQTKVSALDSLVRVLLPYEITLFSNLKCKERLEQYVLLPYEITLFSNAVNTDCFIALFYYLMKLHYSQTM